MSRLRHLSALCALLAGEDPCDTDWPAVLTLANETYVTPQLYAAVRASGALAQAPAAAGQFLREVWLRNRRRNRRLFRQLNEAVTALNAAGLEPGLLKGAAYWASLGAPRAHDRLLADIDLLVRPDEIEPALDALGRAGFTVLRRDHDPAAYVSTELGRPIDVGLIDLHQRPPGPPELAVEAMARPELWTQATWAGVRAKVPNGALYIYLLVLHDQFQDGGYWRGDIALRHLLEIAALSHRAGAVDWAALEALTKARLTRNATNEHLLAAARLCRARPPASAERPWVQLQHARRCAQFAWPRASALLRHLAA